MKHYKSVDFCQTIECQSPLNKRSLPTGDGSVGDEQRQGITLCTCNCKRSNAAPRPSAQATMKTASKRFSTIAFKPV